MWLKRLMDRFRRAEEPSAQERRVEQLLFTRGVYDTPAEFLAALLDALEPPLDENSLAHIARELLDSGVGAVGTDARTTGTDARTAGSDARTAGSDARTTDLDAHIAFWSTMAQRFDDNAYVIACYADTLALADSKAAVPHFLAAFEIDPTLIGEFDICDEARDQGGMVWLRYQLAELMAGIASDDAEIDPRETYSELLELYADDEAALARIREVGVQISHLEAEDQLPRAFVRRGSWREKSS